MIELIGTANETKIRISGFGGSSAANLLGRFCYEKSAITKFTYDILAKEMAMEPDRMVAEIVHLPEARVGNILMRPNFRKFEIPYLAQSILEKENKLAIQDLYISIRQERIYLRSKKHNKEVLPRLTNAHNFSANALPIYQFLADLQTQDQRGGVHFALGPLIGMFDFIPRIAYGNLILQEAQWRIRKGEMEPFFLTKYQKEGLMEGLRSFTTDKGMPQYVLLSEGDNELLINLKNHTSVLMLLESVKKREEFILKDFLHGEGGLVNAKNGYHTNQVVVSLFNEE